MRQWPKQKMHRHPVSPMGVLLLVFFDLFKVIKIIFDLIKVSNNTKKQLSQRATIQEAAISEAGTGAVMSQNT